MKSVAKLAFIDFLALFVVACGGKEEVKKAQTPKLEVKTDPKQNEKSFATRAISPCVTSLALVIMMRKILARRFCILARCAI